MKTITLSLLLSFLSTLSFDQTTPEYDKIPMQVSTDFQAADFFALQASNYLLTTSFDKNDVQRLRSLVFVIKWMTGTPDYSFSLDNVATKIMKGNDDLLGLYMAAMTKCVLENKASSKGQQMIKLYAVTTVLNYCEDPRNNMGMTKNLKKLSAAKAKGELAEAL